ncbi:MAG: hypothetical protein K2K36_09140 [Muribaculaceae bacterium]|nr:hypothetical protein [Muribaculaceae bacterium]
MNTYIRMYAAVIAATLALCAPAKSLTDQHVDSLVATTKIIDLEGDGGTGTRVIRLDDSSAGDVRIDSLTRLVRAFYYDNFRHSQDPETPNFMFMSKSANMMMGIGGVVRMRVWEDFGGAIPGKAFMPYLIPIPRNPAETAKFGSSPSGTALFFQMVGHMRQFTYRLYIEANFNGYEGLGFHLKKAYATVGDWTVGLASSTFSDPAAMAPTVDAQGATNKLAATEVLVRYMPTFRRHWSVGVSVENPSQKISAVAGESMSISSRMPDLAACVQYKWEEGAHVRLSAIMRRLYWRDLVDGRNRSAGGWGVQLSSVARPADRVTTYLTFNCGQGYAGLTNDLLAGQYDLLPDPMRPGMLYAPRSMGYCAGVQYNFTPSLFASASFSQTMLQPRHDLAPDDYKNGWCLNANVFWNIITRLQVAAEFDLGRRQNVDGASRYARRVGALVQFSF